MWLRALVLSLILHALAYVYLEKHPFVSQNEAKPIEVTVLTPPNSLDKERRKQKTVVLAAPNPQEDPLNTDPARFLSVGRQRVKHESRAAATGLTQNKNSRGAKETQATKSLKALTTPLFKTPQTSHQVVGAGDLAVGQKRQNSTQEQEERRRSIQINPSVSMVNEALPNDIKIGEFTSLNTDQYLFYSFYARIAPQIRFHWTRNVEAGMSDVISRGVSVPPKESWITQVEVILDKKGYYLQTILVRSSQLPQFDQAVIAAFQSSTPYLNPPREMAQDDGKIHLRYQFEVMWNPRQAMAGQR